MEAQLQHPGVLIDIRRCGTSAQQLKSCVVKAIEVLQAWRVEGRRAGEVVGAIGEALKIESREKGCRAQGRKRQRRIKPGFEHMPDHAE